MDRQTQILSAIHSHNNRAYGNQISRYLGEKYNVDISVGSLYCELDRMVRSNILRAEEGERTPERGNRPRTYFSITDNGKMIFNKKSWDDVAGSLMAFCA